MPAKTATPPTSPTFPKFSRTIQKKNRTWSDRCSFTSKKLRNHVECLSEDEDYHLRCTNNWVYACGHLCPDSFEDRYKDADVRFDRDQVWFQELPWVQYLWTPSERQLREWLDRVKGLGFTAADAHVHVCEGQDESIEPNTECNCEPRPAKPYSRLEHPSFTDPDYKRELYQ